VAALANTGYQRPVTSHQSPVTSAGRSLQGPSAGFPWLLRVKSSHPQSFDHGVPPFETGKISEENVCQDTWTDFNSSKFVTGGAVKVRGSIIDSIRRIEPGSSEPLLHHPNQLPQAETRPPQTLKNDVASSHGIRCYCPAWGTHRSPCPPCLYSELPAEG
jgi:hypothetical protein